MPRREDVVVLTAEEGRSRLDFTTVYDEWFDEVCRWLAALGGPSADVEDLAQEVFLVVRRKLDGFDGGNLPGWLYRIAANTVSDHRRRAWFRRVVSRRSELPVETLVEERPGPDRRLEAEEARRTVHALLEKMSEKRRRAFVLFEIEGMSGDEIARLEGVPVATVWTRLHHARRDFVALVEKHRKSGPSKPSPSGGAAAGGE
jgi:RNA polymerase sigma-70 factor (ECF subfamily)